MKTIIILGMHRTATSLLARSLHGECYLGSDTHFIPPAQDNPKGFFEDRRIVLFNDFLLNLHKSSWDNPVPFDIEKARSIVVQVGTNKDDTQPKTLEEVATGLLDALYKEAGDKTLGIKDPRMCLLIDFWFPLLKNPQIICSFRDEEEIAKSLNKRNGMSIKKGIELTKYYNNEVKQFISKQY
jgi:hypothetical protein